MKKLVLAFLLVAIALTSALAINTSHAATTANISIDSTTQSFPSAKVGDSIQVNIIISNVQGLWAWDIPDLTFNPAYLNITSVSEGPFLKQAGQSLFIWTSDSTADFAKGLIPDISDTLLEYKTDSGSGVLATLTFTVLALGASQIKFNETTLETDVPLGSPEQYTGQYQIIPSTTTDASITVGQGTSQTPTSTPTSTSTGSTSPNSTPTTSTSPQDSPSSSPITNAPEYPMVSIFIVLFIAITTTTLLLTKKAKQK